MDLSSCLLVFRLEPQPAVGLFVIAKPSCLKSVTPQPLNQQLCSLTLEEIFNETQKQPWSDRVYWMGCQWRIALLLSN